VKSLSAIVGKLSSWMQAVSGIALLFAMLLTVLDVCLRNLLQKPIVGTFEMVGLSGVIIIGFAIPITSSLRSHIYVDFFLQWFSPRGQTILNISTRVLGIVLFVLVAWNLTLYARGLYISGEVTLTRQLPFYPIAFGLAACCIIECLVLVVDIGKIVGGTYE
jgi:TRAP-type C4-dicarboxylate transport system permease small subunit